MSMLQFRNLITLPSQVWGPSGQPPGTCSLSGPYLRPSTGNGYQPAFLAVRRYGWPSRWCGGLVLWSFFGGNQTSNWVNRGKGDTLHDCQFYGAQHGQDSDPLGWLRGHPSPSQSVTPRSLRWTHLTSSELNLTGSLGLIHTSAPSSWPRLWPQASHATWEYTLILKKPVMWLKLSFLANLAVGLRSLSSLACNTTTQELPYFQPLNADQRCGKGYHQHKLSIWGQGL